MEYGLQNGWCALGKGAHGGVVPIEELANPGMGSLSRVSKVPEVKASEYRKQKIWLMQQASWEMVSTIFSFFIFNLSQEVKILYILSHDPAWPHRPALLMKGAGYVCPRPHLERNSKSFSGEGLICINTKPYSLIINFNGNF